jgi:hypothetical protein
MRLRALIIGLVLLGAACGSSSDEETGPATVEEDAPEAPGPEGSDGPDDDDPAELRRARFDVVADLFGIEPTDDELACMTADEVLTMELDEVDEGNLPIVVVQKCVGSRLGDVVLTNLTRADPDRLDEAQTEDARCLLTESLGRLAGLSIEQGLAEFRSEVPLTEVEAELVARCGLTQDDLDAIEELLG